MTFQPWLDPGEKILWSGRPTPARLAIRMWGLPLLFCGIALFLVIGSMLDDPAQIRRQLPSAIFVSLGLVGITLWFAAKALSAWRTQYLITSKRILVLSRSGFLQPSDIVFSYMPEWITKLERSGDEAQADIIFTRGHWGQDLNSRWSVTMPFMGLIGIAEASQVERIIRDELLGE